MAATTRDRKSTRLNSSHLVISYAVFCLKKKKTYYNSSVTIMNERSLYYQHLFYSHVITYFSIFVFFFFNDTATTEIYTLSLHDALPICSSASCRRNARNRPTSTSISSTIGARR